MVLKSCRAQADCSLACEAVTIIYGLAPGLQFGLSVTCRLSTWATGAPGSPQTGITEGFDGAAQRPFTCVYHTDDLRLAGRHSGIAERRSL